jgi:serine/threonine-protein kinase
MGPAGEWDIGRDGATYFLTMEYVSGQDLKSMIAQSGQLAVGTATSIAKQVCDGLAEAHRVGVVHRDLKPQNIQIDKGGQAKIIAEWGQTPNTTSSRNRIGRSEDVAFGV